MGINYRVFKEGSYIMLEQKYVIKNKTGLHARPASLFVKKASSFKCDVKILKDQKEINAKSVIGVLSLGAGKGSEITIKVDGENEENAIKELVGMLESFDD